MYINRLTKFGTFSHKHGGQSFEYIVLFLVHIKANKLLRLVKTELERRWQVALHLFDTMLKGRHQKTGRLVGCLIVRQNATLEPIAQMSSPSLT